MKKLTFFFFINLASFSILRAAPLSLDVIDSNFNSTDKIVLDQDQIQKSHNQNLLNLLAQFSLIQTVNNQSLPSSLFLRGGGTGHILIIIDGVPFYDPSSPQKTLDLLNINLSHVKKIIILKGSQSVLYGGQALSGVVQIDTFNDENKTETSLLIDTNFSKASAYRQNISLNTVYKLNEDYNFYGGVYIKEAQNNSPVLDSTRLYPEKSVALTLGVLFNSEQFFKFSYSKEIKDLNDIDFSDSKPIDVEGFVEKSEIITALWLLKFNEYWKLTRSIQTVLRYFDNSTDQKYVGQVIQARLDGQLFSNDFLTLAGGLQIKSESMSQDLQGKTQIKESEQFEGLFLKSDIRNLSLFKFETGVRIESRRLTKIADSYQVGVLWNNRLKIDYSTGFKAPSLYQLYSPYGDSLLKVEKSKSLSLSWEEHFDNLSTVSMTLYDSEYENLIDFSITQNKYQNILKTRTQGVEIQWQHFWLDQKFKLSMSLGYQEPRDLSRSKNETPWLLRRSLQSGSLQLSYELNDQFQLTTESLYYGEKIDKAVNQYISLKSSFVHNLVANYKYNSQTNIFTRVDNLENKSEEVTYSYFNPGLVFKIGTQITF